MKTSGYSGTPLFKKLGMKPGMRWKLINPPQNFHEILGDVSQVEFVQSRGDLDGIHIFTNEVEEVEFLMHQMRHEIKKNGCIWFSWYKKSSKMPTEVSEDIIRDTALTLGMVDIKVCAVDEKWSALKIVWRLENR